MIVNMPSKTDQLNSQYYKMFAVTETMAAVCGRYSVHVQPLSFTPFVELGPLDIATNLPPGSKASPNKLSIVCMDLSPDAHFLVAADSGSNVYLFEFTPHTWDHVTSWMMDKRTSKVQFDRSGDHIIITDKSGDVFLTTITTAPTQSGPGQMMISIPKKILIHSHRVLDVKLAQDNQKILTCSSDEIVRVSTFPTILELFDLSFKLAHKESVVNIALVNRDTNLISISAEGTLKFWRVWLNLLDAETYEEDGSSNPGRKSHRELKSWNIFCVLEADRKHSNEVVRMAASTFEGRIYIAVLISGYKELPVFELRPLETTLRLFGQTRLSNDFVDLSWRGKYLYVFCPAEATLNKYFVSSHGGLVKEEFRLRFNSTVLKDIAAFGTYNRPFFPAKKRVPSQVIETVAQTKEVLLHEFGNLPSEEEHEAAMALAEEKSKEEPPEQRHARMVELTNKLLKQAEEKRKSKKTFNMTSNVKTETSTSTAFTVQQDGQDSVEVAGDTQTDEDDEDVQDDDERIEKESDDDDVIETIDAFASTQETESIQTDEDFADADYDFDDELVLDEPEADQSQVKVDLPLN